jgi:hypothetical protein
MKNQPLGNREGLRGCLKRKSEDLLELIDAAFEFRAVFCFAEKRLQRIFRCSRFFLSQKERSTESGVPVPYEMR